MISHFLNLESKSFFRSSSFGKNIAMKILMGFFAVYLLSIFLSLGVFGYKLLKEYFPNEDPFVLVNNYMIFLVIADLITRYLMQKIPVMNIKPMLNMPIKKRKLINFILTKSIFSFFNVGTLLMYGPFITVLISKGYDTIGLLSWLFFVFMLTICLNFINFLINKKQ